VIKELQKDTTPDDCKSCEHSKKCSGGLKCLTYALYKDLNHKDVGCTIWKVSINKKGLVIKSFFIYNIYMKEGYDDRRNFIRSRR